MTPTAYIFIGQSGSGKGTQAKLLESAIRSAHPNASLLHFETGAIFRSFIQTNSYTAQKTKTIMDEGKLPAAFIGIHVWSHELIASYTGQDFIIIDGTPRVLEEVPILCSAIRFYGWNAHVIYLEVSDSWAEQRLLERARPDDIVAHERVARLQWFHDTVMPAVHALQQAPEVSFASLNGERSIEVVHQDIVTQFL